MASNRQSLIKSYQYRPLDQNTRASTDLRKAYNELMAILSYLQLKEKITRTDSFQHKFEECNKECPLVVWIPTEDKEKNSNNDDELYQFTFSLFEPIKSDKFSPDPNKAQERSISLITYRQPKNHNFEENQVTLCLTENNAPKFLERVSSTPISKEYFLHKLVYLLNMPEHQQLNPPPSIFRRTSTIEKLQKALVAHEPNDDTRFKEIAEIIEKTASKKRSPDLVNFYASLRELLGRVKNDHEVEAAPSRSGPA